MNDTMKTLEIEHDEVRAKVREQYGRAAAADRGCGCAPTCCGTPDAGADRSAEAIARGLGYSPEQTDETEPESREIRDLRAAFLRMIHSLPEPYREALLQTELEGLTQQEFAMKAGISLSGAKSRVQRARRQLKTMLTECCAFEFDRRGGVIECTPRAQANCAECR